MTPGDQNDEFGSFNARDDQVYQTLRRGPKSDAITDCARRATIFLEAIRDEKVGGMGSGFIVRVPNRDKYRDDFVIVTARHNITEAELRGCAVRLVLQPSNAPEPVTISIPQGAWFHGAHDVAVALLPLSDILLGCEVQPLMYADFSMRLPDVTPLHANLYGRGTVGLDTPLIVRTAWVQTAERPRVNLQGVERPVRVLIAEGTITVGMSGGPVVATTGIMNGRGLIGLLHGYDQSGTVKDPRPKIKSKELRRVRVELLREINSLRQQVIFIVPSADIVQAIITCLTSYYPKRHMLTTM